MTYQETDQKKYSPGYNDVEFRQALKIFLDHGRTDCSRSDAKLEQRFNLQYDQEEQCGDRLDHIKSFLGDVKGKKVLEIGSGSGGLSVALARLGALVCGVEPDEKGFSVCQLRKKRYPDIDLKFMQCPAEKLLFENDQFDYVVMISVLEHVADPRQSLREIYRVLKPGGVCFVDMPNRLWPIEAHYRMWLFPVLPKWCMKSYLRVHGKSPREIDYINFFTEGTLSRELRRVGFTHIVQHSKKELLNKINNSQNIHTTSIQKILKIPVLGWVMLWVLQGAVHCSLYPTLRATAVK